MNTDDPQFGPEIHRQTFSEVKKMDSPAWYMQTLYMLFCKRHVKIIGEIQRGRNSKNI